MLKYFSLFHALVEGENWEGVYSEFAYMKVFLKVETWKLNLNAFWACLPFIMLFW